MSFCDADICRLCGLEMYGFQSPRKMAVSQRPGSLNLSRNSALTTHDAAIDQEIRT